MTVETFLAGVDAIARENPAYKLGHDGSDGFCDCIGLPKGAIKRGGGNPSGLQGTNFAARKTIQKLKPIPNATALRLGDVVLKARKPGDSGYDLPQRYRIGGADYNGDLTDYYHIGVVTRVAPLEITHMTTPHPKRDTKLGKWSYFGTLPQVEGGEPLPETFGTVTAASGSTVNMRRQPTTAAALVDRVPVGSTVQIIEKGAEWHKIVWQNKTGFMMACFLVIETEPPVLDSWTVTITGLSKAQATALVNQYPGAVMSIG